MVWQLASDETTVVQTEWIAQFIVWISIHWRTQLFLVVLILWIVVSPWHSTLYILGPGARFSKVPRLFGRIAGDLVLFVINVPRRLEIRNFAPILIFISFTTYEKIRFKEWAGRSFTNGFSGPKSLRDFRETGPGRPSHWENVCHVISCNHLLCTNGCPNGWRFFYFLFTAAVYIVYVLVTCILQWVTYTAPCPFGGGGGGRGVQIILTQGLTVWPMQSQNAIYLRPCHPQKESNKHSHCSYLVFNKQNSSWFLSFHWCEDIFQRSKVEHNSETEPLEATLCFSGPRLQCRLIRPCLFVIIQQSHFPCSFPRYFLRCWSQFILMNFQYFKFGFIYQFKKVDKTTYSSFDAS